MHSIRLEGVCKSYANDQVLHDLTLEIPSGKFFVLLGPSGCGKTTLLRLLAGLEHVDAGKIYLGERDITNVPIYKRTINTVFQHYALFPHLNVFDNVAYSLHVRGTAHDSLRERVNRALKMVRLTGMEKKHIGSLSGGQKQRVGLARALVSEPDVLLLDEPLAAIDFNLKEQLLIELINLQEELGTTFVYVTHDQFEALTVADTMAIMNVHGSIEQIGIPRQLYEFPVTRFVANFVGKTNILEGTLRVNNQNVMVTVPDLGDFSVFVSLDTSYSIPGGHVFMSIRPEKIYITKKKLDAFSNAMSGVVEDIIYFGQSTQYRVRLGNGSMITVFDQNDQHFPNESIGYDETVHLYFQKENVVILNR